MIVTQQHRQSAIVPVYEGTEFCYTIAQFAVLAAFNANASAKTFIEKNFILGLHFKTLDREVRLTAKCFGMALNMRLSSGKEANPDLLATIPAAQAITMKDCIDFQNDRSAHGKNGLAPIAIQCPQQSEQLALF